MQMYDSIAEAKQEEFFSSLSCTRSNDLFPSTFTDKEGTLFHARPDFYHAPTGLFIEYKPCKLNSRTSKSMADKALARQSVYRRGSLTEFDKLNFSWSNSIKKQAIVQRQLTPANFILVFDTLPDIAEAERLKKAGLVFCDLKSLPSYLAFIRFQQVGLMSITFKLSYPEAGKEFVLSRAVRINH